GAARVEKRVCAARPLLFVIEERRLSVPITSNVGSITLRKAASDGTWRALQPARYGGEASQSRVGIPQKPLTRPSSPRSPFAFWVLVFSVAFAEIGCPTWCSSILEGVGSGWLEGIDSFVRSPSTGPIQRRTKSAPQRIL